MTQRDTSTSPLVSIALSKVLFILAIYAVLFLFFVTNALAMTGFDFVPSVCIGRLAAIAATVLVARYHGKAVIPLSSAGDSSDKRERAIYFGGTFALGIVALFPYYIAYFPGGFGADCRFQLDQVLTGKYNDWHPAIHTLLFYTVLCRLGRCLDDNHRHNKDISRQRL